MPIELLPNRKEQKLDEFIGKDLWVKISVDNNFGSLCKAYVRFVGKSINARTNLTMYAYNCVMDYYVDEDSRNFFVDFADINELNHVYRWSIDGISICMPMEVLTTEELYEMLGVPQ